MAGALRACFAELKDRIALYSLGHEKELCDRPLGSGMGFPARPSARATEEVKPRAHSLRDIFDAIFYVLKTGCHWRLLPHDFPPWQTVFYRFRRFRLSGMWHRIFTILRAAERKRAGKDPDASAAIMDSQSIKTTEECRKPDSGGYDAHKNVKGRKRHLLVDTLGLPLSIYVSPADVQDRVGARLLLAGLNPLVPRLKKIWADGAYSGEPLAQWCREQGSWELEIVERGLQTKGFEIIPKRWIVERTIHLLDWSQPQDEQRLRAEGADQRVPDESRDDPSHLEATGLRAYSRGGSKSSMGLPEGSSSRICLPPLPPMISLRKCAAPELRRLSTSATRSWTSS